MITLLKNTTGEIRVPMAYLRDYPLQMIAGIATGLQERFEFDVNAEPDLYYFINANVPASRLAKVLNDFYSGKYEAVEHTFVTGLVGEFSHTVSISQIENDECLIKWDIVYNGPDLPSSARVSFRI